MWRPPKSEADRELSVAKPAPGDASPESAQLSSFQRVSKHVGSIALDRSGLLASPQIVGVNSSSLAGPNRGQAQLSDAEIMLRVQSGDDAAFTLLVEKFRRPLVAFMYRMARSQGVAEELAQEVFLRVYRSRQNYAAEAKFSTWLYRIATNLALNHLRDTRHERQEANVSLDEPDEETGRVPDLADKAPTAEQILLSRERALAIRRHVESLPERQRLAVVMHKYQGMDYREISRVLRLSESATKSLLFRAYQALREKLKDFV